MAIETIVVLVGALAAFAAFGAVLAYANVVAGERAITPEQEQALRAK